MGARLSLGENFGAEGDNGGTFLGSAQTNAKVFGFLEKEEDEDDEDEEENDDEEGGAGPGYVDQ